MGAATWYFPCTSTEQFWLDVDDFRTITLPLKPMIQYDPTRTVEHASMGSGYTVTYVHGGGQKVQIVYDLGEQEDIADQHVALLSQLLEGRPASFAFDTSEAWAVPTEAGIGRGDTGFTYDAPNPFALYASIDDPVDETDCILQSALPELRREIIHIANVNTGTGVLTITGHSSASGGTVYEYTTTTDMDRRPIVRPIYFLPFLRLVPGQRRVLRQDNGLQWRFVAEFFVDVEYEHRFIGLVV